MTNIDTEPEGEIHSPISEEDEEDGEVRSLVSEEDEEEPYSSAPEEEDLDTRMTNLLAAKQLPGETVEGFHNKLLELRSKAYPVILDDLDAPTLRQFVQGILDPDVRHYVRNWDPEYLSTALTVAQGRTVQNLARRGYNLLTPEECQALTNEEAAQLTKARSPDIMRFKQIRQRAGEPISSYFERFHFFSTRAYPMWDSMKNLPTLADFIQGLADFRVRDKLLRHADIKTFPEAVQAAQEAQRMTYGPVALSRLKEARAMLDHARQNPGESILAYYDRLHELLPEAHPTLDALRYTPLVSKFIQGLRDPRIRNYLLEMDPLNRASALAIAQARHAALAFEGTIQGRAETVLAYHGRLTRLFARAWPSYPIGGSWLTSAFLSGLAEPQVRVRSQGREPQDYRATLLHAHRHEAHLYYLGVADPHPVRDAYWTPHPDQVQRVRHQAYQEEDESLLEYHERLPGVILNAFPVGQVDDQMMTGKFIIGISDDRIKTYILEKRANSYPNYLQAFNLANLCRKELADINNVDKPVC